MDAEDIQWFYHVIKIMGEKKASTICVNWPNRI